MPDLVKVGFTTRDPELRAGELSAGAAHPYLVEYEALVARARYTEQAAHKLLSEKHESKEWFRCDAADAVCAIRKAAGYAVISEKFKRVRPEDAEAAIEREERIRKIENKLNGEEAAVRAKYERLLSSQFPALPFFPYWLVGSCITLLVILIATWKAPGSGVFLISILGGFGIGYELRERAQNRRDNSPEMLKFKRQGEMEIEGVRKIMTKCHGCGRSLGFDRAKLLLGYPNGIWKCPGCKSIIAPPKV